MNVNPDIKKLKSKLNGILKTVASRATFVIMLAVLVAYLVMVWRISDLATAEPTPESEIEAITANTNIPKINKEAVEQIQKLEESSSEVKSLFNKARTNPFAE